MFTKILLAVDGSEHSKKTMEYVKSMAKEWNSSVVIFHSYSGSALYTMEMEEKLKQYSYAIVDKVTESLSEVDINTKGIIVKGHAGQLIVEISKAEKCDLIVMGKHGSREIRSILIGSTSNFVLHNTEIPVFLI